MAKPLIHTAKALRKSTTEAEKLLWYYLKRKQLEGDRFRRQHPIDRYIADFICLEKRLVIELDGGQHSARENEDAERTKYLAKQGFNIIRFWNHDVFNNMEGVLETIRQALLKG